MKSNRWIAFALACGLVVALGASIAFAGVSDAWISTKVKMSLIASSEVGGFPIDVDTYEGQVTLHGKVPSQAEKDAAQRIAEKGTGVVKVRNLLQVVPKGDQKEVEVADDRLKDQVAQALKNEPALANSSIDVKSVNKGVVILSGNTSSLSDHLLALEVTNDVDGVRRVASEIKSPDEFGDRDVWYDENGGAKQGDMKSGDKTGDTKSADKQGNRITDAWITTQVKLSFMTDKDVYARDINVDTRRGVVTLFGTAPTAEAKTQAMNIAKNTAGVHKVNDQLRVQKLEVTESQRASDSDVESAVKQRLAKAEMDGAKVDVDVKARTVRLTGTVKNGTDIYSAVSIAYGTPGVERVVNDLSVEPQTQGQRIESGSQGG
jgi:osmotically-inducible protein OsmY